MSFPALFGVRCRNGARNSAKRFEKLRRDAPSKLLEEAQRRRQEAADDAKVSFELLPQAEVAPVNPIVAAALRRIERAHVQPLVGGGRASGVATAMAVAYVEETEYVPHASTETYMHQAPTDGIAEVSIHEENLAEPFIEDAAATY